MQRVTEKNRMNTYKRYDTIAVWQEVATAKWKQPQRIFLNIAKISAKKN